MNNGIWVLFFLEPILTYLRARRGAKKYHRNIDFYDRNAQSEVKPSKIIARHFGLDRESIPIVIYRRYIMTYICFFRIFALYAIAFLLKFNIPRYCAMWLLTTLVLLLVILPTIIKEIYVENKSGKERNKHRQKKKIIEDLQEDISFYREMKLWNAEMKAQKWINPLTKELDRCTRKQKGVKYIPWDNINYAENKILSKYQKYLYHEIVSDERGNRNLSVYAKKDHRLIYQADIKK